MPAPLWLPATKQALLHRKKATFTRRNRHSCKAKRPICNTPDNLAKVCYPNLAAICCGRILLMGIRGECV